ncbi:hypothetical protein B0H17DRAFT_218219 [Mycena rosella]|uniref:Uncharacterized protein n=1 Tax=Mycena rosella TaxID=1033263 RepID=A0AAD7G933_MYCRO|nr:hypothetical protein B0H17DRAFT_218219 [Mycena rosella]
MLLHYCRAVERLALPLLRPRVKPADDLSPSDLGQLRAAFLSAGPLPAHQKLENVAGPCGQPGTGSPRSDPSPVVSMRSCGRALSTSSWSLPGPERMTVPARIYDCKTPRMASRSARATYHRVAYHRPPYMHTTDSRTAQAVSRCAQPGTDSRHLHHRPVALWRRGRATANRFPFSFPGAAFMASSRRAVPARTSITDAAGVDEELRRSGFFLYLDASPAPSGRPVPARTSITPLWATLIRTRGSTSRLLSLAPIQARHGLENGA